MTQSVTLHAQTEKVKVKDSAGEHNISCEGVYYRVNHFSLTESYKRGTFKSKQ